MNAAEKFQKAKQRILLDHRFFAALMMRMSWKEDTSCKTAWTDGRQVGWNPAYVDKLTYFQTMGMIIHEIFHPIMKHHLRRGNRNFDLWNQACDYAINYLIIQYGFELPPNVLIAAEYEGMSAEEIFTILNQNQQKEQEQKEQEQKEQEENKDEDNDESQDGSDQEKDENEDQKDQSGDQGDQGEGDKDEKQDGDSESGEGEDQNGDSQGQGDSDSDQEEEFRDEVRDAVTEDGKPADAAEKVYQENQMDVALTQAAKFAKKAGQLFPGMERLVGEATKTETPWEEILSRFIYEQAKTGYDWNRPSTRREMYTPSLHNYKAGNIVIVIDSSGSIDKNVFQKFVNEMKTVLENVDCNLWAIIADDEVREAKEISAYDLCDLKPLGGGGTDFVPAFEWLRENDITPTVLIYLTDLCCDSYPEEPDFPVLWATYGNYVKGIRVPFGEKIVLNVYGVDMCYVEEGLY